MADVANLSININTESVRKAAIALEELEKAAGQTEAAMRRLGGSSGGSRLSRETADASRGMSSFSRETRSAGREMEMLAENGKSLAGQMRDLAGTVAGIALAWKSFTGLQELVSEGFRYNEQLEKAQLGIASVVASTMELVDAEGRALQAQEKFNAAQAMSVEMAKKLDVASMQSPAGYTDLLSTFQTLLAPANQLGLKWEDTLDITIKMSNVLSAMGLDMQSLARETQSILTGANLSQSNVASRLGITKEEIQNWKTGAELLENFQKRFEAFKYAGVAVEDTMEAVREYYEDVIRNASGDAFTSLWTSTKEAMLEVANAFYEIDEASGQFRKTAEWEALSTVIDGISSAIGEKFVGAVKTAVDGAKSLGQWVESIGTDKVLSGIGQGAEVAVAGLAALTLARKAATAEFIVANGVEKQQVTGLRTYIAEAGKARQQCHIRAQAELELAQTLQMRAQREMDAHRRAIAGMTANRTAAEVERIRSANLVSQARLTDQLGAANTRLAAAQQAAFGSTAVGAGINTLKAGLSGLVGMLGGPVGIAFTAAAVGATYFLTKTDEASNATKALEKAQSSWQGVMENCVDETGRLKEGLDALQKKQVELARENSLAAWAAQLELVQKKIEKTILVKDQIRLMSQGDLETVNMGDIVPEETVSRFRELAETLRKDGAEGARAFVDGLVELHTELKNSGYENAAFTKSLGEMLQQANDSEKGLLGLANKLGVLGDSADGATASIRNLQAAFSADWQMDTSKAETFIGKLKAGIRDAKLTAEGLGNFKELGKLLPNIPEKQLGDVYRQYKKGGQGAAIRAIGDETYRALPGNAQIQLNQALSLMKQLDDAKAEAGAYTRGLRSSGRSSSRSSGASAARQAAIAQEDYTAKIAATEAQAKKLEVQLGKNADIAQYQALEQKRIEAEYQEELKKNSLERQKMAKSVGAAELASYETAQNRVAELNRELKLKESQRSAEQKSVQLAQGQVKFYKELATLSGGYCDDLELQKKLIANQAREYRETYHIADDLVSRWEQLQLLQASNDPFDGATRGLMKFSAELHNSGREWEDISYNFGKSFMSTTRSMFDDFLETGRASLDGFRNIFRQLLKDIAWQALAQPIVVSIVGGVTGALWGGSANAATGMTGGSSSDLVGSAVGLGQQYALGEMKNQLFGSSSGLMGGLADSINSTVASWFPGSFASSGSSAALNAATIAEHEMAGVALPNLPTSTFTQSAGQFLGNFTGGAIGAGIGSFASPYVNSLLGLQNNAGSSTGSLIGGLSGTVLAGGLALAGAIPGAGWAAAGIGALGSLLGGGIGSLFGGDKPEEPELYLSSGINLWEKARRGREKYPGGARSLFEGNGYFAWMGGAQGTNFQTAQAAAAYANEVLYSGQLVANSMEEALGAMNSAIGRQYAENLKAQGELRYDLYLAGEQLNAGQIEKYGQDLNRMILDSIVDAMIGLDLTPLTIAADGFAANTRSEIRKVFNDLFAYANTGMTIEDEDSRNKFNEGAISQMATALANVDFAPLSQAADGFAVDTLDELTKSLEDMFGLYDLSANLQDEEIRRSFQSWAQKAIAQAFSDVDLSFLRVDFDRDTFAGLQQAYAATQAWKAVDEGIRGVLAPASEFETAMHDASRQFTDWIASLRELGWQEEALMEIEQKRADYMSELARQMRSEMQQSLSLRLTALKSGSDSFAYGFQSLRYQQINELETAKGKFGANSGIYGTLKLTQQAETTQYALEYLKAQKEQLEQKKIQAEQEEIRTRQQIVQAEISAKREEISAANNLASQFRKFAEQIAGYRRDLWSGEDNLMGSRYQDAYRQFDSLYQRAMAGDEEAYGDLAKKADELLGLGRDTLPHSGEYNDLFYEVDQKLKDAEGIAHQQLTEAERQLEALNAQVEGLEREQEILSAQSEALQTQIEQQEEANLSLEQIDAGIAALQQILALQTQAIDKAYQQSFARDWEGFLAEVVAGRNGGNWQGRNDWTSEDLVKEAEGKGLTLEEWAKQVSLIEGYTLQAAESTNSTLDYLLGNLGKGLDHTLDYNAKTLNGSLLEQLGLLDDQGLDISNLLGTQLENWPLLLGKMDELGLSFSDAISGLAGKLPGSSVGEEGEGGNAPAEDIASASTGSSGGSSSSPGSWMSSMMADIGASANSSVSTGTGGVIHTVDGSTLIDIFNKYSVKKYATGGLTPLNEPFLVGENGPEMLMSPRQWGVLTNPDTKALFRGASSGSDGNGELEAVREALVLLAAISRQILTKLDEVAWLARRDSGQLREWNVNGLPVVRLAP